VAAYLAKGVDHEKFGPEITDYVRFNAPKPKAVDAKTIRGVVLKVDRFGNLITNFTPQDVPALFAGTAFKLTVGKREITSLRKNFSEGAAGEVFALLGSMGYLEIAANRGAANQLTSAAKGAEVSIKLEGAAAAGNGQD
jgi:S-adenosylmethionine hydrolase